jgi:hypothetical protein
VNSSKQLAAERKWSVVKQDLKTRLDAAFAGHAEKDQQRQAVKRERLRQDDIFLRRFHEVSSSLIKPALEEIGAFAQSKGLGFRIDQQQDGGTADGKHTEASISIRFYPGENQEHRPAHEYPHLSVMCSKFKQNVWLHQSTLSPGRGGQAGSVGEFQLDDLSEDLIQEKIADLLHKILV